MPLHHKKHPENAPLLLVDGSSYLYRAFYAMPNLTNSQGFPTGAIYGVVNMLKSLQQSHSEHRIIVVFDAKGKTFRDELYSEYKANRAKMPDELRQQIQPLHQLIRDLGFPLIAIEGVEADDVIGTMAIEADKLAMDTLIATGDKDIAQLVNPRIKMIDTMKGMVIDEQAVFEKFSVRPSQIRDYLALIGDTSDNVPGIPKVGPKTAAKWLEKYQNLANIVENSTEIGGKVGENLRNNLEQLKLSYQLVTLKTDVPLAEQMSQEEYIHSLQLNDINYEALKKHYALLGFKTWLGQLLDDEKITDGQQADFDFETPSAQRDFEIINDWQSFNELLNALKEAEYFALDVETTSLDYMQAELVGMSFCYESGKGFYIPLAHNDINFPHQLDRKQVLQQLKPILEQPEYKKLGQNLKYDAHILKHYDIELNGIAFDTMLESYVLDSTASRHNLDDLALKYLNYRTIHFEDVAGKGAKQISFADVPVEQAAEYASEDADIALRLHQYLWPKLEQKPSLQELFEQIELPLLSVLMRMEHQGVCIDIQALQGQSRELEKKLYDLQMQAFQLAGEEFNLASPKQIQHVLYEKLRIPIKAKTPKGAPSTSESALQDLALDYPLPKLILQHRSLAKLKTTYTDKLPLQVDANSNRVHTSYNQAVAVTGRLSSTEPNLQNIPVRSEEGRRIRQAFIAQDKAKIIAADYSQIELRIMAHLSDDPGLMAAFNQGLDVHRSTAAEVFGVTLDEVSSNQRRSAKAINFGLIYGMSAFGLAKQLDISRKQAQEYIELYFQRYPRIKSFMDEQVELAHQQGYVETIFGRRLYLPEINSRNGQRRRYAERTAINAPMQGSAADIIKRAMLSLDAWLIHAYPNNLNAPVKMLMQVHDELLFEVEPDYLTLATDQIRNLMEGAADMKVPMIVDIGVGNNWDEAH